MELCNDPPQIFDPALRQLRRQRAERRNQRFGTSFLIERCVQDAIERLCDINRTFENAMILGHPSFVRSLGETIPTDKIRHPLTILSDLQSQSDTPHPNYDLVISGLDLHNIDDVPAYLRCIRQALRPDGLFIGALFGGETLAGLRQALYATDTAIWGGVSARVYPFVTHTQAAGLLQNTGFALPVIDIDRITVNYRALERLISDLRDLGDTNILQARDKRVLNKAYWQVLKANCKRSTETGKMPIDFEIYWMTGWTPHESQQKPLKPGSAKIPLSEALRSIKDNKDAQ